jgi:hypothetical protein
MSGTSKNVRIRNVSYIAACFGGIVTTIPRRFIDRCRNVDLAAVSNAQFCYPYLKSCALHRDTEIVALFKKNQRRMYDCKAWPCDCSLDWVLRRTTERSFTNELGDVTPLGAPSCCFRNQAFDQQSLDRERHRHQSEDVCSTVSPTLYTEVKTVTSKL